MVRILITLEIPTLHLRWLSLRKICYINIRNISGNKIYSKSFDSSRHVQTSFLCWFTSTIATDQNNKTLVLETDTVYGRYMVDRHVSPRKNFFLQFCICFRKPLLGNLFVVDRIFFGGIRPEDIEHCHS